MSLEKFTKEMAIIQQLDDEPNDVGGLTAAQLKAKFDEGGQALKDYLNGTLLPALERLGVGAILQTASAQMKYLRVTADGVVQYSADGETWTAVLGSAGSGSGGDGGVSSWEELQDKPFGELIYGGTFTATGTQFASTGMEKLCEAPEQIEYLYGAEIEAVASDGTTYRLRIYPGTFDASFTLETITDAVAGYGAILRKVTQGYEIELAKAVEGIGTSMGGVFMAGNPILNITGVFTFLPGEALRITRLTVPETYSTLDAAYLPDGYGNTAVVPSGGAYGFSIDNRGNLILTYAGDTPPDYAINDAGNLILTVGDGQTIDLGQVRGADGKDGVDGKDGANGTNGVDGQDGAPGADGRDGTDGVSPTVELVKADGITTMTVTDAAGTHSTEIKDGTNGVDGVSPTVAFTRGESKTTVTITDAEGEKTAEIPDGATGPQGDPGKDNLPNVTTLSGAEQSLELAHNVEYRCADALTVLTITGFGAPTETGKAALYSIVFTASADGITVTLPDTIVWAIAEPVFTAGCTYWLTLTELGAKYLATWVEVPA